MKHDLPYLLNLPPFTYRGINFDDKSLIFKILFIIKGKILSFIINKFEKKTFCSLINIFYRSEGNISYLNNYYQKTISNIGTVFYPNKRILRVINHDEFYNRIYKTYCLHFIEFDENDLIVDCGANVGELFSSLKYFDKTVKYIGIEPDLNTFECLNLNIENAKNTSYNIALSNNQQEKQFFFDNYGGNSSLEKFGDAQSTILTTKTLDSFGLKEDIKLFKIDAEGHELEALEGAKNSLNKIEYITVDFGFEKGENQDSTIVEVNNFLIENNFELYKFSEYRLVGLYKNKLK